MCSDGVLGLFFNSLFFLLLGFWCATVLFCGIHYGLLSCKQRGFCE